MVTPSVYMSVKPPRPSCESCGAHAKQDFGPVVEMEPRNMESAVEKRPRILEAASRARCSNPWLES